MNHFCNLRLDQASAKNPRAHFPILSKLFWFHAVQPGTFLLPGICPHSLIILSYLPPYCFIRTTWAYELSWVKIEANSPQIMANGMVILLGLVGRPDKTFVRNYLSNAP
jgi:hypothetical protein